MAGSPFPDSDADADPATPVARLRTELERLEDAYRQRWGPDEEHQLYRDIAEAFRPSVHSLEIGTDLIDRIRSLYEEVGTPTNGVDDISSFVQALTSHPIVEEGIQLRYAHEALALLHSAEMRVADLLELMVIRHLSPRAEEFLRRATRLYVWGFDYESIVMCGATLETAYSERFSSTEFGGPSTRRRPHVRDYLELAETSRVFTKEHIEKADRIRRARNRSVHSNLEYYSDEARVDILDPKECLRWTADLLQALFPTEV